MVKAGSAGFCGTDHEEGGEHGPARLIATDPQGLTDARGLDFIIIGAQNAGTRSLLEHLREHPELYLPPGRKEPWSAMTTCCDGLTEVRVKDTPAAISSARQEKGDAVLRVGCPNAR